MPINLCYIEFRPRGFILGEHLEETCSVSDVRSFGMYVLSCLLLGVARRNARPDAATAAFETGAISCCDPIHVTTLTFCISAAAAWCFPPTDDGVKHLLETTGLREQMRCCSMFHETSLREGEGQTLSFDSNPGRSRRLTLIAVGLPRVSFRLAVAGDLEIPSSTDELTERWG